MTWLKSVREWFHDLREFMRVRKEQKAQYSPIVEDLETINALGAALQQQIEKFHKRYNMFPEAQSAADKYTQYLLSSQRIYQEARRDVLNNILAEKNKPLLTTLAGTHQGIAPAEMKNEVIAQAADAFALIDEDSERWISLYSLIAKSKPFLAKIVAQCPADYENGMVILWVTNKPKLIVDTIVKSKALLEGCCEHVFGEGTGLEILTKGEDNE